MYSEEVALHKKSVSPSCVNFVACHSVGLISQTQLILALTLFFFFQAVSLYLPPLLCCFNHIVLSKHTHGGGAAFLEITMSFFVKAEENN